MTWVWFDSNLNQHKMRNMIENERWRFIPQDISIYLSPKDVQQLYDKITIAYNNNKGFSFFIRNSSCCIGKSTDNKRGIQLRINAWGNAISTGYNVLIALTTEPSHIHIHSNWNDVPQRLKGFILNVVNEDNEYKEQQTLNVIK
jgi:hypothetical protein